MAFGFDEAQEMFRREVANFAQKELAPGAKERAKKDSIDRTTYKKLGDMGFLGLGIPEKYGGQPSDWTTVGILVEELTKVDSSVGVVPAVCTLLASILLEMPEDLKNEWIPRVVSGDTLLCFCLTEPDCGSDAAALKTKATKEGDSYILNGEKTSVTMGLQADAALIFAKTDPTAKARGITLFLVPTDTPGITKSAFPDMGFLPYGRASFILDGVKIPASNQIGETGKAFYTAMHFFDVMRACLGLNALALAQTSLNEAIEYAKQRTAFGKPIAKFEGVSFKIAEAATLIEAARLLCYKTLWMVDNGLPTTKEAAMCKWWCPRVAVNAIHDCLLIHGHIGYSEEYPVEQRLRDAIGFEIADGCADIQKIIISREIIGREFLPY